MVCKAWVLKRPISVPCLGDQPEWKSAARIDHVVVDYDEMGVKLRR